MLFLSSQAHLGQNFELPIRVCRCVNDCVPVAVAFWLFTYFVYLLFANKILCTEKKNAPSHPYHQKHTSKQQNLFRFFSIYFCGSTQPPKQVEMYKRHKSAMSKDCKGYIATFVVISKKHFESVTIAEHYSPSLLRKWIMIYDQSEWTKKQQRQENIIILKTMEKEPTHKSYEYKM